MASTLSARELAIIEARFGFDGDKRTLEALAKEYNVSRSRIGEIERKALKKLHRSDHRRRLYDALEVLGGGPRPLPRHQRPGSVEWWEAEKVGEQMRRIMRRELMAARMLEAGRGAP